MSTQGTQRPLGLSQAGAARRAGVSLATWCRWEKAPDSVSAASARKCAQALISKPKTPGRRSLGPDSDVRPQEGDNAKTVDSWEETARDSDTRLAEIWAHGIMTPRQASAIMFVLAHWVDGELQPWLDGDLDDPLFGCGPFAHFDERVMMLVDENKAFAAKALERCRTVLDEIERGVLPFDREGCYFDEVLMGAALLAAPDYLNDMPELFQNLPERPSLDVRALDDLSEEEVDIPLGDDDWDMVSDNFDDRAQWDDWEVPVYNNHPILSPLIERRHPFRWFDPIGPRPTMRETVAEHHGLTEAELSERIELRALAGTMEIEDVSSPLRRADRTT